MPLAITHRALAGLPDAGLCASGRSAEYTALLKGCGLIRKDPAVIWVEVAVRPKRDVKQSIGKQQCGPLHLLHWTEKDFIVVGVNNGHLSVMDGHLHTGAIRRFVNRRSQTDFSAVTVPNARN